MIFSLWLISFLKIPAFILGSISSWEITEIIRIFWMQLQKAGEHHGTHVCGFSLPLFSINQFEEKILIKNFKIIDWIHWTKYQNYELKIIKMKIILFATKVVV